MIDDVKTPYEDADHEAKLIPPAPAKKNGKIVAVGLVIVGLVLGLVILANVAGLLTKRSDAEANPTPKPVTLGKNDSDNFAQQQAGQAAWIKGQDRDKKLRSNEDTILGKGNDLAGDPYNEADGIPEKTKAQNDAEHGHGASGGATSEAEQMREKAALEAQNRRKNDLDSSPVSVDFSDYFEKEKAVPTATATTAAVNAPDFDAAAEARAQDNLRHHKTPADISRPEEGEEEEPIRTAASRRKDAHDPSEDYTFDSSFGKLYRLMEDTIIETVLVNRVAGASVGPVITMVTTDVYSASGSHLLIPKGTRMLGKITAVSSLNQERLFVAFHRMIMFDGYSVSLDKFQGLDVVGQAGLRDLVNHHYVQIFGASLALAAVGAVTQIGNAGATYGSYDYGVAMRNGISQQLGESAQRVMDRFLNVLPTFTIRERARVKILLSGDLLLPDTKNHTMDPDL
jgi:type IV secretory pathway VirB10-like protein